MSKLIDEFDALRGDKARWDWLIANKDKSLRLVLDNDDTMIVDNSAHEDDENNTASFDSYIGWSEGVLNLLHAIGIDAECC